MANASHIRHTIAISIFYLSLLLLGAHCATYTLAKEFVTNQFTDDDILGNGWVLAGANAVSDHLFSECAGVRLLGGYGVVWGDMTSPSSLSKTWSSLPPHYEATISMTLYKIDSWDSESMFVMVDGVSIDIMTWGDQTGSTDICGDPNPFISSLNPQYNQKILSYSKTITHTSQTLTIKLASSLDSWTGSWGVRDFQIVLKRCASSCLTCVDSTVCYTCDAGLTLVGAECQCGTGLLRVTTSQCATSSCVSCVASCPNGYYGFSTTLCAACSIPCATCTALGSLPPACTSCATGYIDPGNGTCMTCFGYCSSCTGLAFNQCTSCDLGYFFSVNQCYQTCPDTFFPIEHTSTCVACTSPCLTCDGSTTNHCLSCISGQYLFETACYVTCPFSMFGYNGICLGSCPIGTYADASFICQPCPTIYCETCDTLGACGLCVEGSFYNPFDSLCYLNCPTGFYGSTEYSVCIQCDSSCLTCSGSTSSDCLSCQPLTYLVYGSCYSVCPAHTFSVSCQLCDDSCLNCTAGTATSCTSCNDFYMLQINQSRCLEQCREGDIADNQQMTCMTCTEGYVGYFQECKACASTCNTCFGIWYLQCLTCEGDSIKQVGSTCIHQGTRIVSMPGLSNSPQVVHSIILYTVIACLVLGAILQCLFVFKTALLPTIQLMQFLSYFYYLSCPFAESTQRILLFLYHAHPTSLISTYHLLPSLKATHPMEDDILVKAAIMDKSAIFLKDTMYIQLTMIVCGILLGIAKISRNRVNAKINPYIVSYTFRLLFMEFTLGLFLYLTYFDISSSLMRWSLALLIIDFIALGASFFWKIRTGTELGHAHYALFYFNELGPPMSSAYSQISAEEERQRKSILPSMIYYFGKLPLVVIILFFRDEPLTQSICLLIYVVFLAGINYRLEYRRRMYRTLTYYSHGVIIGAAIFVVTLNCGLKLSGILDMWLVASMMGLLCAQVLQVISNHELFTSIYFWGRAKLKV